MSKNYYNDRDLDEIVKIASALSDEYEEDRIKEILIETGFEDRVCDLAIEKFKKEKCALPPSKKQKTVAHQARENIHSLSDINFEKLILEASPIAFFPVTCFILKIFTEFLKIQILENIDYFNFQSYRLLIETVDVLLSFVLQANTFYRYCLGIEEIVALSILIFVMGLVVVGLEPNKFKYFANRIIAINVVICFSEGLIYLTDRIDLVS